MKRNLYLLAMGVILCSCSDNTDIVTGRATVVLKNPVTTAPVVATPEAAPLPIAAAPVASVAAPVAASVAEEQKAPEPVVKVAETAEVPAAPKSENARVQDTGFFLSQNQTETKVIPPAPAPAVSTPAPAVQTVAPAPEVKPATPAPVASAPAAATVVTPTPAPTPKPTISTLNTSPHTTGTSVRQNQPRAIAPYGHNYTNEPVKRNYPIMPGQNRGLRSR